MQTRTTKITEQLINSLAPNESALLNGKKLVKDGQFESYHHSPDEVVLFGFCHGSGKQPYLCSADFADEVSPVFRCNCPSRQFPCKHSLGLLWAAVSGQSFTAAPLPDSLVALRDKAASRAARQGTEKTQPRKVNKSALQKKIQAQLGGLDLLEQLTFDLTRLGIGNTTQKSALELATQAEQLGNCYLPGARNAVLEYLLLFLDEGGIFRSATRIEEIATEALDQLTRLHALVRQGRAYLNRRLDDPELAPDTDSGIAAWLGHVWQLKELREAGLVQANAELVQVAFNSYSDQARKEYVETGVWINLEQGLVQLTQNFRPFRAARFVASQEAIYDVVQVPELCIYPGDLNRRVRWDTAATRSVEPRDLQKIRRVAPSQFAEVIKQVKTQIKSPLADKQPVCALSYMRLGRIGETFVIEDSRGERIALADDGFELEPPTCDVLRYLSQDLLQEQTLVGRFRHDLVTQRLRFKPLCLVSPKAIVRLTS